MDWKLFTLLLIIFECSIFISSSAQSTNETSTATVTNKNASNSAVTSTATPYKNSALTYTVQVDNNCIRNELGKGCFEIITKSRTFVLCMQGKILQLLPPKSQSLNITSLIVT